MDQDKPLQQCTLGAVSYLNAQPLLVDISCPILKDVPSRILDLFNKGVVDAALLSAYDVLKMPKAEVVNGISIACKGEVYSVFLAYQGLLSELKEVALDPSSHTANQLLKVLLSEYYNIKPNYSLEPIDSISDGKGCLLIGDPAIVFRKREAYSILDLGEAWMRFTNLPFVFALWCLRSNYTNKKYLIKLLQLAKQKGLLQRESLAALHEDPLFALRYLNEYIRYDLGDEEKKGLDLFRSLLEKWNLLPIQKKQDEGILYCG